MLSKVQVMFIGAVASAFLISTSSTPAVLASSSRPLTSPSAIKRNLHTQRLTPRQSPAKKGVGSGKPFPAPGNKTPPPSQFPLPHSLRQSSQNANIPEMVVYPPVHPSQYGKCPYTKKDIILYPRTWTHTPNITPPLCSDIERPEILYGEANDNWSVYLNYCSTKLKDQRPIYDPVSLVGQGNYGRVWAAANVNVPKSSPDSKVAIKCAYTIRDMLVESAHLKAASKSGHPNIVRYLGTFGFVESTQSISGPVHRPVACLVQEWVRGSNLDALVVRLKSIDKLSTGFARSMLSQLIAALMHIHSLGMVHRDVQLVNAFVDTSTGTLKLGDFGLATYISSTMDSKPEIVKLYPSKWEEERLFTGGYDPYLKNKDFGAYARPDAMQGPKAYYLTEVYAVGSLERGLITAESQDEIEKSGIPRKLADRSEALNFYVLTRLPIDQRPTLSQLQHHQFLTNKRIDAQ